MKFKPTMWAVAAAPLLLLLLLVGGLRGAAYFQGKPLGESAEVASLMPQQMGQEPSDAPKPPLLKTADKSTVAALQKVIGGQIAALQKRDFTKALTFSAPQFRSQWKPSDFGQMITSGYGELMDAKTVSFGTAQINPDGRVAFVSVVVRNAQKRETRFSYILTRDPATDGKSKSGKAKKTSPWCVSGCERQSTPEDAPRRLDMAWLFGFGVRA